MIKDATASRLTLVDSSMEDALTVSSLLDILISGESFAEFSLPQGYSVIKFARKYEFDRLLALIKLQIGMSVDTDPTIKSEHIRFALALGDYPLCALKMRKSGGAVTDLISGFYEELEDTAYSAWILDPTSLGYADMQTLPRPVFWAWCRAYCNTMKPRTRNPNQAEAEILSKEFPRLMDTP